MFVLFHVQLVSREPSMPKAVVAHVGPIDGNSLQPQVNREVSMQSDKTKVKAERIMESPGPPPPSPEPKDGMLVEDNESNSVCIVTRTECLFFITVTRALA